ncbi:MAG: AMP-binding protein [Gammaproteobacteria bacterium]|nr:AMP-binding protein [Gammaproteobacteria bacterium]
MSETPWRGSYPDWVPHEIDMTPYDSLWHMVAQAVDNYADRHAVGNFGTYLTFNELDQLSRQLGAYLQHEAGIKKGDRVALMMPNMLQYPVAILAVLRIGGIIVNTNPMYTPRELRHQLTDSGARAIIAFDGISHTVAEVLADTELETVITTRIGDLLGAHKKLLFNMISRLKRGSASAARLHEPVRFETALSQGASRIIDEPEMSLDDVVCLQYTGGTTGVSKGVMLTHGNLVANILQNQLWWGNFTVQSGDALITALPLYHIYSLSCNLFNFLHQGGVTYLITDPRNITQMIKEMARHPFVGMTGVNTLYKNLILNPAFEKLDFSRLHYGSAGGMAVQTRVAERWTEITGTMLVEGYGLTECSPVATCNPANMSKYVGSCGLPYSSTHCSIRDENRKPLPVGEVGELCIKGPQVMAGYWQRPEATAEVLTEDGWLHTGDIGRMDEDGFFYIVDRKKDMIVVSGFNVYPNEIEDVIASMDGVREVAVIGVDDEQTSEAVKAVIVLQDETLTEEMITAHCRKDLTRYKCPRHIQFVDELPKSEVGKILRRKVRDQFGSTASTEAVSA